MTGVETQVPTITILLIYNPYLKGIVASNDKLVIDD